MLFTSIELQKCFQLSLLMLLSLLVTDQPCRYYLVRTVTARLVADKDIMENIEEEKNCEKENRFSIEQFDVVKTVGTGKDCDIIGSELTVNELVSGTFARVCLCYHKPSSEYFALKILSFHEVIRLNQVEHVMNEKSILQAST